MHDVPCCAVSWPAVQDFVHYVLKHSMVVLMTARDESTSFKIFSTLNGRGVDLAVIDKLKPEMLQVTGATVGGGIPCNACLRLCPSHPCCIQRRPFVPLYALGASTRVPTVCMPASWLLRLLPQPTQPVP